MAVGALSILSAYWADMQLAGLEPETVVFPHVLLWVIKGVGAVMIVHELIWGRRLNLEPAFSKFPIALVPLVAATIGYIFAVLLIDYYVSTAVYLFVVAMILEKKRTAVLLTRILPIALGTPFFLYLLFYRLLDVRMHSILF
jgi:hypothetical protein